ncbi:hypothetical protein [Devosia elaeis]|nr:hypothetical protein [Devosia elaeis]
MVHFFGIFGPGRQARSRAAAEAPAKASFFGGLPDAAQGAVPLSRAEQDACYLNGKAPEPPDGAADGAGDGFPRLPGHGGSARNRPRF